MDNAVTEKSQTCLEVVMKFHTTDDDSFSHSILTKNFVFAKSSNMFP